MTPNIQNNEELDGNGIYIVTTNTNTTTKEAPFLLLLLEIL